MIDRLLRAARDPDLRGYVRWAALKPSTWRVRRPDLTSRKPPYLGGVRPVSLPPPVIGPLLQWGEGQITATPFRLAATTVSSIDWSMSFSDIEDEASLHRFAWLLPWMGGQRGAAADAVWNMARSWRESWVEAHPRPTESEAWQAYTTSERMVNWIVAALAVGRSPVEGIEDVLRLHSGHLIEHLEYYGDQDTGNHLANNGRALYFAGIVLGDSEIAAAGREIVLREQERLFENGFLREDSTHYQFLVTRKYGEVLWLARVAADEGVVRELEPAVEQMERACAFFSMGAGFPLIGDVSPDCAPEWPGLIYHPVVRRRCTPANHSSWGRLDRGRWTVIAHVNREGAPSQPGHAHNDTGGIVVFRDDKPLIVEAGRRTYVSNAEGMFGIGGWSHSLLMIDGRDPAPVSHWLVNHRYALGSRGSSPQIRTDESSLQIDHSGFSRIPGVGGARRLVRVGTDDTLEIEDSIEGHGSHRVTLVFHTPTPVALQLPSDLRDVRTWHAPADAPTFGWGTPRYGDRVPLFSLVAEAHCDLPWKGVTRCAAS